ncbi:MAG: hypothetical protein JKY03_01135 [Aureispira sp.]|nr:hypothetical protein [Aureispira sp.]
MKKNDLFLSDLKHLIKVFVFSLCLIGLFNTLVCHYLVEGLDKYVLDLDFWLAFIAAIPIISGFIISVVLKYKNNLFLEFINSIFLATNALIIIGGIVVIFLGCFRTILSLSSFLYLGLGLYLYLKTIKITQGVPIYKKKKPTQIINSDILDDNLSED